MPSTGIFRGESAVILLAGSSAQAMLIKAPVAEHIGFTPSRGGGYPNSLMGVFSALRQTLLDAQHYAAEQAAYAKNPRGMRRPEPDPSLDALQPVLQRQIPVVMEASSQREIERALDLAKEFNIRPIIAGGEEADLVAARLKAENVPVLLSLNFPRRPQASPDADPEPLRTLRARVEAPKLAAKLQQAGVKFAFEDGGLTTWSDYLGNVARAVENGLTADQAVRALTLTPAEILGVSDRLGTIEAGKVANLTVTRGDLFTGRVAHVFIDGVPIEPRAPANAAASLAAGTWTITITTDEGEKPVTLTVQQVGDQLRGTIQGSLGSSQISNGSIGPAGDVQFTRVADDGLRHGGRAVQRNDRRQPDARHGRRRRASAGDVRGHETRCRPGRRAAGTAAGRGRVSGTVRGDHPFESLLETSMSKLSIAILVVTAASRGRAAGAAVGHRQAVRDADQERDGSHGHQREAREHRPAAAERQDRADRQESLGARGRDRRSTRRAST